MGKYLINTERLGLRNWNNEDLHPMGKINADPRVMEYFQSARTLEETQSFIDSQQRCYEVEGYCFYAADELASGELIGFIGIKKFRFEGEFSPGIEIGWRLGFNHWGKGYATEGAIAVLNHAFEHLDIDEIWSFTTLENNRSENVMKKIGMSRVGSFEHPAVDPGHPLRPHVLYHITRS